MKAIVLAAGEGRRFRSREKDLPKVMQLLGGRPVLRYVLDALAFIPPGDTAVVVGSGREKVTGGIGGDYRYPVQERQLGTAHAALCAREALGDYDGDVLVLNGDMPLFSRRTYEDVIAAHQSSGADCTVLTAVAPAAWLRHGRILRGEDGGFQDIVEYADCSPCQREIDELNTGVYVFRAGALFEVLERVGTDNRRGEYYLTDVPRMMRGHYRVETHTIKNSNEIYGVNTQEELDFCAGVLAQMQWAESDREGERWFGTGGWRAVIGDGFTKANIRTLCQAVADDMREKGFGEIVIGYDRRFLSDRAARWAAEVFAGNGIAVDFIGRIAPTPLVMYTVARAGAGYGLAVTASHNPAEYNGIKLFTAGGRDAAGEVTDAIEERIRRGACVRAAAFEGSVADGTVRIIDPQNDYIDSIIAMVDMEAIRARGLRVLLDPMFGVAKTTLQTILVTARCDVDVINARHDALFGGQLPSPSADTLHKLRDMVVQGGYDLGIGTDGDADRIGIIDEAGRYVHPNEILSLLYHYLLRYKGWKGDCVRNLGTTHILDRIAAAHGQVCHEVPVGFKHISRRMEETGALIGGESSGGLTIRGHIRGKDGIFASALIVEMLGVTGKSVAALLDEIAGQYGRAVMTEYDTRFSADKKHELHRRLFQDRQLPDFGRPVEAVEYLDGLKVRFAGGGWILVRFSGTEPLLRIFCEMETREEAEGVAGILREFLGV